MSLAQSKLGDEPPISADLITLLRTNDGKPYTKRWCIDGTITGYGDGFLFEHREIPVSNINELSKLLSSIENEPQTCALRYQYAGPNETLTRRLGKLFRDQALHSLCIDVDKFEPLAADPVADPVAAILEYIRTMLPAPFHGASFHWQLSSSAGHPTKPGLRAHLWFWLAEPRTSAALKAWADAHKKEYQLDATLYRTVQVHYTAAPILDPGVVNPVRVRSGFTRGAHDEVTIDIAELPPQEPVSAGTVQRTPLDDEQVNVVKSALAFLAERKEVADNDVWSNFIGYPLLAHDAKILFLEFSASAPNPNPKQTAEEWWTDHIGQAARSDYRRILKFAKSLGWVNPWSSPMSASDPAEFPDAPKGTEAVAEQNDAATPALKEKRVLKVPGLMTNDKGNPLSNARNAVRATEHLLHGRLTYDEFLGRVMIRWPDAPYARPWEDRDTTRLQIWLQDLGMVSMSAASVDAAAELVASTNTTNSVADWLNGLQWDGTRRVSLLLPRAFGTPTDRYNMRAGRNMFIALVARALQPGCQVDEALVFEGDQGTLKSSALRIIGGEFFKELTARPDSKDFEQQLRGVWLGEFSELAAIKRADDIERLKQFISNRVDHYRPSYGRAEIDLPRRVVFCGTTNKSDWNNDPTGARRFIPVEVMQVDLEWLRRNREQLFAEAVSLYRADRKWWIYPREETRSRQDARNVGDPWTGPVRQYLRGRSEIDDLSDLLELAVDVPVHLQQHAQLTRIGTILRKLGCSQQNQRRVKGRRTRPWTVPAEWAALPLTISGPSFPVLADETYDLIGQIRGDACDGRGPGQECLT
jgi:predicted P-loop ATPase